MGSLIVPDWPAPANIRACCTTRRGGVSLPPYASLNLGDHVGDMPDSVAENRQRLITLAGLPAAPQWLQQTHGTDVVTLDHTMSAPYRADGVYSQCAGQVCAVMTADCLPVLFCDRAGKEVAAAHAGWRGLCAGILENTLACFNSTPGELYAWLGPAIGPQAFEVGPEVKAAFVAHDPHAARAFSPHGDTFFADIYQLARLRLLAAGVTQIYGAEHCTLTESASFFSYRRDGVTGRMASLVWLI
ncbi:purine nucleoside phosphorylase YfiH [Acerihabitans sp. TG2]|uniref:purine nucleoside phosphorylase YfiH n=1 Tax=Acerihabitans sp. TG2 TaxID=3096008 RepID=UPI002B238EEC|nr:purine nucleoside phosphorylase YfiH [Acerihabitans sp. TG2]MEA9392718.1 purine nucleoside phosphorylase YfiH [Acerihabitans sp. TG2]